jgi:hypothetical protein
VNADELIVRTTILTSFEPWRMRRNSPEPVFGVDQ